MAPTRLQQQRCSLAGVLSPPYPLLTGLAVLLLISVLTNKRFLWSCACPNLTWDMLYKVLCPLEPCPCAGSLPIPVT